MRNSRVADVMSREVVSIRPFTPFKDIVWILLEHEISAVPVVDEEYHVAGMVSQAVTGMAARRTAVAEDCRSTRCACVPPESRALTSH